MTAVADQLVWTLARQVRAGDVVVVGVATPIATAAALLARELLVPDVTVIVAASVDPAAHDIAAPMLRPDAVSTIAAGSFRHPDILDAIQRGRITLQFASPAQVDAAGRLNTSRVRAPDGSTRRLPGGLATADIAVLVGRLVAYRAGHSRRFLPERVDFVTGAGHDRGAGWRRQRGLGGAGVQAIVTDTAVLEWDAARARFRLAGVQPGSTVRDALEGCGFEPLVDADVPECEAIPARARELLDGVIDPHRLRRLETRDGRQEALDTLEALRR